MTVTNARSRELRDWAIVLGTGAALAAVAIGAVTFTTHVVGPLLFTHYGSFPALASVPKRETSARHVPGDPVNVAVVATDSELAQAFAKAGWTPADPVTRASSLAIARSVLLDRPDSAAPVSPLYLFGRIQDRVFELEVGRSARQRHHIRLWLAGTLTVEGRPVWVGGASFDRSAGISHRGLHPTHHIDPDVDKERDGVETMLAHAGQVQRAFHVTGIGVRVNAKNAEGDRFDTDGELTVIVVPPGNVAAPAPRLDPDPPLVQLKDAFLHRWHGG